MLNKLKFNNLVISNKKGIQQSRIQTINKLVHKIRKLKTLLEKHPDNTKCKERIRKSTETMELLKKLKRVDIMKKVLLLDKPAPAVMTNGLATPEEVGVALLCMNKVMQGLIKRFKTELQLDDAENAGWKETLMESSKRRQKIERTEEKRRKRLEMKQQKAMGRKRQEWLEENQESKKEDEEHNTEEKEANVSTTGSWQVEELPNETVTTEEKKMEKKSINNQLKRERPVKEKPKKMTPANKKQKLNEEIKKETPQIKEDVEDSGEDTESEQEEETIKESKHKTVDSPRAISEDEEQPEEEMVVDPFFITDTGENYLSTAVIKRNQNNDNENTEETRDLHMIKLNNYDKKPTDFRDRRQQNRDWKQKDFNQNRQQNNNNYNNNKWNKREEGREQQQNKWQQNRQTNNGRGDRFAQNNKWNDRKHSGQDFKPRNNKTNNVDEKLHPSWAAKQKLKPVIAGFQGKKITFGDDGDNGKQMQQPTFSKTQTPKSGKTEQDSLHPSWAAKQKLKPAITAFQGKKITFDNDE